MKKKIFREIYFRIWIELEINNCTLIGNFKKDDENWKAKKKRLIGKNDWSWSKRLITLSIQSSICQMDSNCSRSIAIHKFRWFLWIADKFEEQILICRVNSDPLNINIICIYIYIYTDISGIISRIKSKVKFYDI